MKYSIYLLIAITVLTVACKKKNQPVNGMEEFTTAGVHSFVINDATDITATLLVIGGGGGGGGGADYDANVITPTSTGGGGGGGAGERVEKTGVVLQSGVTYDVLVGSAGTAGGRSGAGGVGGPTGILDNTTILLEAFGGFGGSSSPLNEQDGAMGGTGYPNGQAGSNGEFIDANGDATAGVGGAGGDNGSPYGKGGTGGNGSGYSNYNEIAPTNGVKGGTGYVRIEWSGTEEK